MAYAQATVMIQKARQVRDLVAQDHHGQDIALADGMGPVGYGLQVPTGAEGAPNQLSAMPAQPIGLPGISRRYWR
ncbi:MAG: hypothetical protein ACU0DH_03900 [Paracoccus sp. (in: a-proteobacteria)]|uniref:hypothetical protein n=1 Tax=Paracoccus sp. TaxID=267 RepID=UPI004059E54D